MADITATVAQVAPYMADECQIRGRTCGAAVTAGNPVYYGTDGKAYPADADAASPAGQVDGIALDTKAAGEVVRVLEEGWLAGYDLSGLSYNANVYLSTTAGALADSPPTAGVTSIVGRVDWRNTASGTFEKVLRVDRHPRQTGSGGAATKTAKVSITGAALHAGVLSWQNPSSGNIDITRVTLVVSTAATAAATASVGTTTVSATTASANLIDTLDTHTATGAFDNITDKGTNGKSRQRLASGKWVTISETTGDNTGLVATLYIDYIDEAG